VNAPIDQEAARTGLTCLIARAEAAAVDIRAASNNASVNALAADLSSRAEVRRLASDVHDLVGSRPAHGPGSSSWPPVRIRSAAWTSTTCKVSRSTQDNVPTTPRSTPWRVSTDLVGVLTADLPAKYPLLFDAWPGIESRARAAG
jgi:hypothetical protein